MPVQVRVCRDVEEYDAQVLHAWASCDVALLTVKDCAFWSGLRALRLGGLPHLQSGVRVSRGWSVWMGGGGRKSDGGVLLMLKDCAFWSGLRALPLGGFRTYRAVSG